MLQFIIRRLIIFIPMLFLMSVVAFAIIQAPPGDFLTDYIAQLQATGEVVDEGQIEALRDHYGLNQPLYVQYLKWVWGILQWDLGLSLEWGRPVVELVNDRLAMTIVLGVATILFTWTLAIPIGILSAVKKYTVIDYFFTFLSYFGVGTPNFMIAACGHVVCVQLVRHQGDWAVLGRLHHRAVEYRKGYRPSQTSLAADANTWNGRHGALHSHSARESA